VAFLPVSAGLVGEETTEAQAEAEAEAQQENGEGDEDGENGEERQS